MDISTLSTEQLKDLSTERLEDLKAAIVSELNQTKRVASQFKQFLANRTPRELLELLREVHAELETRQQYRNPVKPAMTEQVKLSDVATLKTGRGPGEADFWIQRNGLQSAGRPHLDKPMKDWFGVVMRKDVGDRISVEELFAQLHDLSGRGYYLSKVHGSVIPHIRKKSLEQTPIYVRPTTKTAQQITRAAQLALEDGESEIDASGGSGQRTANLLNENHWIDSEGEVHSTQGTTHSHWAWMTQDKDSNALLEAGWIRVAPPDAIQVHKVTPENIEKVMSLAAEVLRDGGRDAVWVEDEDANYSVSRTFTGRIDFSDLPHAPVGGKVSERHARIADGFGVKAQVSSIDELRSLTRNETQEIYDEIMNERGADPDFVDWTCALYITADGRVVLSKCDGGVRGEDHRMLGGYAPMDILRATDGMNGEQSERMNFMMRELGFARLLYFGMDFAAIDYETELTRQQHKTLAIMAESTGITRLEYHPPAGEMVVVDPSEQDISAGPPEPPPVVEAVVVAREFPSNEVDYTDVLKVWWDTDDTAVAEQWVSDNAAEVRDELDEDVCMIAAVELDEFAYDENPRDWNVLSESGEVFDIPPTFVGETAAEALGVADLLDWPSDDPEDFAADLKTILDDAVEDGNQAVIQRAQQALAQLPTYLQQFAQPKQAAQQQRRQANRKIKRKFGPRIHEQLQPILEMDAGAGTQYGPWMYQFLNAAKREDSAYSIIRGPYYDLDDDERERPEYVLDAFELENLVHRFKAINDAAEYLNIDPKLVDNVPVESTDTAKKALREYRTRLYLQMNAKRSQYGREQDAQFNVLSSNIVETLNFDAACFLHGSSSGGRFMPWCGGTDVEHYANYGSEDFRRFIVYPEGPDTEVTINKQKVPWSEYAFTVSVRVPEDEDESFTLNNINDPENKYYGQDDDFDEDGAQTALKLVGEALNVDFSNALEEQAMAIWAAYVSNPEDWHGFEGDVELAQAYERAGIKHAGLANLYLQQEIYPLSTSFGSMQLGRTRLSAVIRDATPQAQSEVADFLFSRADLFDNEPEIYLSWTVSEALLYWELRHLVFGAGHPYARESLNQGRGDGIPLSNAEVKELYRLIQLARENGLTENWDGQFYEDMQEGVLVQRINAHGDVKNLIAHYLEETDDVDTVSTSVEPVALPPDGVEYATRVGPLKEADDDRESRIAGRLTAPPAMLRAANKALERAKLDWDDQGAEEYDFAREEIEDLEYLQEELTLQKARVDNVEQLLIWAEVASRKESFLDKDDLARLKKGRGVPFGIGWPLHADGPEDEAEVEYIQDPEGRCDKPGFCNDWAVQFTTLSGNILPKVLFYFKDAEDLYAHVNTSFREDQAAHGLSVEELNELFDEREEEETRLREQIQYLTEVQTVYAELQPAVFDIPVDLTDWPYADRINEKLIPPSVRFVFHIEPDPKERALGYFSDRSHQNLNLIVVYRARELEAYGTIEHELVHLAQAWLRQGFGADWSFDEKRNKYTQSYGHPTSRPRGWNEENDPHAGRSIEFWPRLADEIREFKRAYAQMEFSREDANKEDGPSLAEQIHEWMNFRPMFQAVKERLPSAYKKLQREFYRAVAEEKNPFRKQRFVSPVSENEDDAVEQRQARTLRPADAGSGIYFHGTSQENLHAILQDGIKADTGAKFAPAVKDDPALASEDAVYFTTWLEQAVRYGKGLSAGSRTRSQPAVVEVRLDPQELKSDRMDDPSNMRWENKKNPFKPGGKMMRDQMPQTQFYLPRDVSPQEIVAVHVPTQALDSDAPHLDVPSLAGEAIEAYEHARQAYWNLKKILEEGPDAPGGMFGMYTLGELFDEAVDELAELHIDLGPLRGLDLEDLYYEQPEELEHLVGQLHSALFTDEGVGFPAMRDSIQMERMTPQEYLQADSDRVVQANLRHAKVYHGSLSLYETADPVQSGLGHHVHAQPLGQGSTREKLLSLKADLAKAAQGVYDAWDADADSECGDPEVGFGGICHLVADAMAEVLDSKGFETTTMSAHIGDQHVWALALADDGVYEVDIQPFVYEEGSGYTWTKIPGVTIGPDNVDINKIGPPDAWAQLADVEDWARQAALNFKPRFSHEELVWVPADVLMPALQHQLTDMKPERLDRARDTLRTFEDTGTVTINRRGREKVMPFHAPEGGPTEWGGVALDDGRHRLVTLYEAGYDPLPVAVHPEERQLFLKNLGLSEANEVQQQAPVDVPPSEQKTNRREAAYAPEDAERRSQEIAWMRQQLGLPERPPEDDEETWHKLYQQLESDKGYSELARVTVHSNNVVETHTMDAAYCLYGAGSKGVRTPWCGNRSRGLYDNYGSDGLRRFLVLPNGPSEYVELDGQNVPVAPDAYTFAITPDGRVNNVNDYKNRYFGVGLDVENGIKAAALLDEAMNFDTSAFFADENQQWDNFDGYVEAWADENFTPANASLWRSALRDSNMYGEAVQPDWYESYERYLAETADAYRQALGDNSHLRAGRWADSYVPPGDAGTLQSAGITPDQFDSFVQDAHRPDAVFRADNEGLRWEASTVVDAMKYGLPPDYLPEFTSGEPSTEDVQVAAKLVRAAHPDEDLVDFEELVQWTRKDPKRRVSWYATHPSERQLTFFLDEYPLRVGESPAKIIASLETLFGDLDTALKSGAHQLTQRELFEQAEQKRQDKTGERLSRSSAWTSIARKNDLQGAGVMFICPEDQTIFLVRRAPGMRNGNLWSVPGGMVDDADASSWDAATREVQEELGSWPGGKRTDQTIYETDDFQYTTHVVTLTANEKQMFDVELNSEATDAGWFTTDELEDLDLHPGLAYSLLRLQTTERTASLLAPPPAMVRKVLDCAKTEGTYTVRFDETDWAHAKDVSTGFPLRVVVSPQQSLTNWWQSQGGAGKIESVYAQDERTLHLCVGAPHTKIVPEMMQYAQHLLRTHAASAPR